MFGFSFGELLVISLVTLVAVGPQKLPGMLKTMGQWARKLRKMTMDVRQQTGIDEMLRAEGIQLSELRSLMRGYHGPVAAPAPAPAPPPAAAPAPVSTPAHYDDPYGGFEPDPTREYPPEGADSYGALPDDLLEPASSNEVAAAPGAPEPVAPPEPEPAPIVATPEPEPEPAPVLVAPVPVPEPAPVVAAPVPVQVPEPASAPPPPPARSVAPPPPSSRATVPRPSGTPPPPPRRSGPPRPEPSSPASKPDAALPKPVPPSPGNVNGNG